MNKSNGSKSIEELRYEIAETRQRVQADVAAFSYKVSPQNLKEEGKQMMKDEAQNAKSAVQNRVREGGREAAAIVRRDPVPTMLVGAGLVGLGWWVYSRRQPEPVLSPAEGQAGEAASRAKERAQSAASTARERAQQTKERAKSRARETAETAEDRAKGYAYRGRLQTRRGIEAGKTFVEENPLAAGAIAVATGFGIAALLPRTRWEDRTIGPQRDRFVDAANQRLSQAADIATEGAREMVATAEQEGQALGDETKEAARNVARAGKQGAEHSAERQGIESSQFH